MSLESPFRHVWLLRRRLTRDSFQVSGSVAVLPQVATPRVPHATVQLDDSTRVRHVIGVWVCVVHANSVMPDHERDTMSVIRSPKAAEHVSRRRHHVAPSVCKCQNVGAFRMVFRQ